MPLHKKAKAIQGGSNDEQESNKETAKSNLYQIVTDRIIASLKAGVIPWEKPWQTPHFTGGPFPRNFRTGRPYAVSTSCSLVEQLQLAILAYVQSGEGAKRHCSQG